MKQRLQKPELGNPYYNTVSNGGYSGAIVGNPTDSGCNVLANCVGYAAGRFNEIIGAKCFQYFKYPPDAENFIDVAKQQGLKTGIEPKLGAIIVWAKGKTWNPSDGSGHVAIVEDIKNDGSIITSESGYGSSAIFWTMHRYRESGNWGQSTAYKFLGFVYQPDAKKPELCKGMQGDEVENMQARLHALGYLRKNEIDGIFGKITLGAVCAFQLENNLKVDGICGTETYKALNI